MQRQRKNHSKWIWILLFEAGICCFFTSCGKTKAFKHEYRMQVTVGSSTYWGMGAAKFAELVKQKTKGVINIKPYYGSQLLKGDQLNSAQMVASGAIDCAFESTINMAPVIPEMNIFTLPFFVETYENTDKLEQGKTGKIIFEKMEKIGLMPLAWGENGFRQLTNSKRPVKIPKDLKDLKIRIVGSQLFIDIFRALGADPVNMNWGDAVTALQQKTVDGQENPAAILMAVKIYQYNKYMTAWNYAIDPLILFWNKKEFDAFPTEIRKAIREAACEAAKYQKALCRVGLDKSSLKLLETKFNFRPKITNPYSYLRKNGMKIEKLSDAQRKDFKSTLKPVIDKWTKVLGSKFIKTAKKDIGK